MALLVERIEQSLLEQGKIEQAEWLDQMDTALLREFLEEAYALGYEDGACLED